MSAPLLRIEGLDTAYGASQVLFGPSFVVGEGEVATLLGRNGMGKTTTVRSIMGLTRARAGEIRFRGTRIERHSPDRIARMPHSTRPRPIARPSCEGAALRGSNCGRM